mmetsp:Transcript_114981/g.181462  ORF Transcript_114981/g.181462 Transcript_114981/m.181462 type:complete len:80 (+) Transcript_114981:150-389(+)
MSRAITEDREAFTFAARLWRCSSYLLTSIEGPRVPKGRIPVCPLRHGFRRAAGNGEINSHWLFTVILYDERQKCQSKTQ